MNGGGVRVILLIYIVNSSSTGLSLEGKDCFYLNSKPNTMGRRFGSLIRQN